MSAPSVVLAGGGTAGHISPMLAIADAIARISPVAKLSMVGTKEGLETRLVPAAGYELDVIEKTPLPRRPSVDLLRLPGRFRGAVEASKEILQRRNADVVVGVGGYVCTPVYLAARSLKIPVVIHEANVRPGLANRVGSRKAAFIGTAFANSTLKKSVHVGMPMDRDISTLDRSAARATAREELGLEPERTTLVITGGSSGALNVNRTIASAVDEILATGAQILHLTGRGKVVTENDGAPPLSRPGYHQREYLDGMHHAYAAADLMVARSGAATVCEVAAVGLPTVFVPLPIGNGEQELNAADLVEAGGALLVKDEHFNPDWIQRNVVPLLEQPQLLATMQGQAEASGITDADETMAKQALAAAGIGEK